MSEQIMQHEFAVRIYPQRTLKEWIEAGKYTEVSPEIRDERISLVRTGVEGVAQVVVFCLGKEVSIDDLKEIRKEKLGLGSIGFEHQAALGEQHPAIQCELSWIVNIDLSLELGGTRELICLAGTPSHHRRTLRTVTHSYMWARDAWFLGLKK